MRTTGAVSGSICTLGALLLGLSEWFASSPLWADSNSTPQIKFQKEPVSREVLARTSFAPMVKKVGPSVVTIYSTSTKTIRRSPLLDDPFFRRFFGMEDEEEDQAPPQAPRGRGRGRGPSRQFREQNLGSGVIV